MVIRRQRRSDLDKAVDLQALPKAMFEGNAKQLI